MTWQLRFSKRAIRQLGKLDRPRREILVSWLEKQLDGCDDPRAHGKGLTSDRSGQWRYRIGDYRVLCELDDGTLVVMAVPVGHRSSVYRG